MSIVRCVPRPRHTRRYPDRSARARESVSHDGFSADERDEDGESDGVDGGGDVEDGDPTAAGHLQDVPGEVHPQEPFQHGVNNQRVEYTIGMILLCAFLVSSMITILAKS